MIHNVLVVLFANPSSIYSMMQGVMPGISGTNIDRFVQCPRQHFETKLETPNEILADHFYDLVLFGALLSCVDARCVMGQ